MFLRCRHTGKLKKRDSGGQDALEGEMQNCKIMPYKTITVYIAVYLSTYMHLYSVPWGWGGTQSNHPLASY